MRNLSGYMGLAGPSLVLPEVIPRTWERDGVSDFRRRLERCVRYSENHSDLRQHLRKVIGNAAAALPMYWTVPFLRSIGAFCLSSSCRWNLGLLTTDFR